MALLQAPAERQIRARQQRDRVLRIARKRHLTQMVAVDRRIVHMQPTITVVVRVVEIYAADRFGRQPEQRVLVGDAWRERNRRQLGRDEVVETAEKRRRLVGAQAYTAVDDQFRTLCEVAGNPQRRAVALSSGVVERRGGAGRVGNELILPGNRIDAPGAGQP